MCTEVVQRKRGRPPRKTDPLQQPAEASSSSPSYSLSDPSGRSPSLGWSGGGSGGFEFSSSNRATNTTSSNNVESGAGADLGFGFSSNYGFVFGEGQIPDSRLSHHYSTASSLPRGPAPNADFMATTAGRSWPMDPATTATAAARGEHGTGAGMDEHIKRLRRQGPTPQRPPPSSSPPQPPSSGAIGGTWLQSMQALDWRLDPSSVRGRSLGSESTAAEEENEDEGGEGITSKLDMLAHIMEMMAEGLRNMKQANENMRRKLKRLKTRQAETNNMIIKFMETNNQQNRQQQQQQQQTQSAHTPDQVASTGALMHRHRHRRRPITTSEHPSMDFKGETLRTMHKITSGRHDLHAPPPDFQFTMPPRFFPSSKDFISTSIFSSTATIPEQTGREASAYDIAPYRSEAHNSQQTSLLPRSIFDTNIGLFSEASKVISFLHQYPVPHQFAITSFRCSFHPSLCIESNFQLT